jgi:hypothetical protein
VTRLLLALAAATGLFLAGAHPGGGAEPTITTSTACRGGTPLITVAIGEAPPSWPPGPVHVAIGKQDNEVADLVADVFGDTHPGGGVSSTVPRPGPTPVVVTWPDATTTRRTVTVPECPTRGKGNR